MATINLSELKAFAATLADTPLATRAQGKPFTVTVTKSGFQYVPSSTKKRRTNTYKAIESVLDRFASLGSYQPGQYNDLTVNASYLLAIIELFEKHARQTTPVREP
ncbi:MAG: hypothetical protein M3R24_41235 [Chloroflexota bacterium]|nr:hypothetical protein [Chloroflexota bacterium]